MIQKIAIAMLLVVSLVACKKEKTEIDVVDVAQEQKEIQLKNISFEISGMTCEVGCAGTIQKKLKDTKGVQSAEIDFEAASAVVGFDANVLSTDDVIAVVEGIAGGELYKVSNVVPYTGENTGIGCCAGKCVCKEACAKDSVKCKKDSLKCVKGMKPCCADSTKCKKGMKACCVKKCAKDSLTCKKKKAHCQMKDSVR